MVPIVDIEKKYNENFGKKFLTVEWLISMAVWLENLPLLIDISTLPSVDYIVPINCLF